MKGPPNIENLRLYYTYDRWIPCISCDMWIQFRGGYEGEVIIRNLPYDIQNIVDSDITVERYNEIVQKYIS